MSTVKEEETLPPIVHFITAPNGWTINGKEVVCLGDLTTHGGRVITATGLTMYNGRRVARVGDKVSCPQCKNGDGGEHIIMEPMHGYFENGKCVATHGTAVSCGARLIAHRTIKMLVGDIYDSAMKSLFELLDELFFEEVKFYPGRGLPKEEYCRIAKTIRADEDVMADFKEMYRLTQENQVEYAAWIVEDPPGKYRVVDIHTDEEYLFVDPGEKPANAVAHVHTHVGSGNWPSDDDETYYGSEEDKCLVYFIIDSKGKISNLSDVGEYLPCND